MTDSHPTTGQSVTDRDLSVKVEMISNNPVVGGLLHATSGILAVLDEDRRILSVNDVLLRWLGVGTAQQLLGLRPGDALQCVHAHDVPTGCGTGPACLSCGAAIAIVAALTEDTPVERTCTLTCQQDGSNRDVYLRVQCCPLRIDGRRVLLLYLQDITEEQQATAVRRIFFHDVANIVTSLMGLGELLVRKVEPAHAGLARSARNLIRRLETEVRLQLTLANPEQFAGRPPFETLSLRAIMDDLEGMCRAHPCSRDKRLVLPELIPDVSLKTDGSLLLRVLSNMLINAFEATDPHDEVELWADSTASALTISVWNRKAIPPEIIPRIFQRNFSTKATLGRGLGTYSMKLIAERFLGGSVTFSTSPAEGTIFTLTLPLTS